MHNLIYICTINLLQVIRTESYIRSSPILLQSYSFNLHVQYININLITTPVVHTCNLQMKTVCRNLMDGTSVHIVSLSSKTTVNKL